MSRVEENAHLKFKPSGAAFNGGIEYAKVSFLEDISRSLAVLADASTSNNDVAEADICVRDHLLIEWMLDFMNFTYTKVDQVESVYSCWINWLKERGGENE